MLTQKFPLPSPVHARLSLPSFSPLLLNSKDRAFHPLFLTPPLPALHLWCTYFHSTGSLTFATSPLVICSWCSLPGTLSTTGTTLPFYPTVPNNLHPSLPSGEAGSSITFPTSTLASPFSLNPYVAFSFGIHTLKSILYLLSGSCSSFCVKDWFFWCLTLLPKNQSFPNFYVAHLQCSLSQYFLWSVKTRISHAHHCIS